MQSGGTSDEVQQFGQLQQQYQSVIFQKETIALQLQETESAIKELASAKGEVFRATGMILVKKDASALRSELEEQKELFGMRVKSLEKQEKLIGEKLAELQKRIIQSQLNRQKIAGSGAE